MKTINEELTKSLKSKGASLVGFADLQEIEPEVRDNFPRGISIAVALNPNIMEEIHSGPTKTYVEECMRVDDVLNTIGPAAVEFLQNNGYESRQLATTNKIGAAYPPNLTTPLPHKTVATRAGLGWIGKTPLLITVDFGSAVRLTSVLTDAPFTIGQPVNTSACGECNACVDICPANAITGKEWHVGIIRDDLLDAFSCRETARKLLIERTNGAITGRTFCGMCIVACPWTKKYLESSR